MKGTAKILLNNVVFCEMFLVIREYVPNLANEKNVSADAMQGWNSGQKKHQHDGQEGGPVWGGKGIMEK